MAKSAMEHGLAAAKRLQNSADNTADSYARAIKNAAEEIAAMKLAKKAEKKTEKKAEKKASEESGKENRLGAIARSIFFSFSTALSGVVTTGRPVASATSGGRRRHAVLRERDQVAIAQIL